MLSLFQQRASCFNRPFNNASEIGFFLMQSNFSSSNARNVEQVIYQMRKLSYLAFDDSSRLLLDVVLIFLQTEKMGGVENGRQRISQFLCGHRQEFVLPPVKGR